MSHRPLPSHRTPACVCLFHYLVRWARQSSQEVAACLEVVGLRWAASEVTGLCLHLLLQVDIEQLDPRGRTPLHLATTLGHLDCARVLLAHGADVGRENRSGWTGGHPFSSWPHSQGLPALCPHLWLTEGSPRQGSSL